MHDKVLQLLNEQKKYLDVDQLSSWSLEIRWYESFQFSLSYDYDIHCHYVSLSRQRQDKYRQDNNKC